MNLYPAFRSFIKKFKKEICQINCAKTIFVITIMLMPEIFAVGKRGMRFPWEAANRGKMSETSAPPVAATPAPQIAETSDDDAATNTCATIPLPCYKAGTNVPLYPSGPNCEVTKKAVQNAYSACPAGTPVVPNLWEHILLNQMEQANNANMNIENEYNDTYGDLTSDIAQLQAFAGNISAAQKSGKPVDMLSAILEGKKIDLDKASKIAASDPNSKTAKANVSAINQQIAQINQDIAQAIADQKAADQAAIDKANAGLADAKAKEAAAAAALAAQTKLKLTYEQKLKTLREMKRVQGVINYGPLMGYLPTSWRKYFPQTYLTDAMHYVSEGFEDAAKDLWKILNTPNAMDKIHGIGGSGMIGSR